MSKSLRVLLIAGLVSTLVSPTVTGSQLEGDMNCNVSEDGSALSCNYDMYKENHLGMEGTILRSINNSNPAIPWTPAISDLNGLSNKILSGSGSNPDNYFKEESNLIDIESLNGNRTNKLSLVYEGIFDTPPVTRDSWVKTSRPYQILGSDIEIYSDSYDFEPKGGYLYKTVQDGEITFAQAVNTVFKVNPVTTKYRIQTQHKSASSGGQEDSNGREVLPIAKTPFINLAPDASTFIYTDKYYTDVFVSRNMLDVYWEDAINRDLVRTFDKNVTMNLADYALFLSDVMYMSGEEVLNEEEQNMLVAVYGKDLPYYLETRYLDAVKYLVARGIVEPDMQFDQPLRVNDMLEILMRAMDKPSRLDFKKMSFEYSEELVALGYYPTQAVVSESPIQDLDVTKSVATATHYDYLVEKIDKRDSLTGENNPTPTTAYAPTDSGFEREVKTYYVSRDGTEASELPAPDSDFLGEYEHEGKVYLHFRVPINYEDRGYVYINTLGVMDSPKYMRLEHGGGFYENPSSVNEGVHITSTPFDSTTSVTLIDKRKRLDSFNIANNGIAYLSATPTEFKFNTTSKGLGSLLWKGKPLTDAGEEVYKKNEDGTHSIFTKEADPYKELLKNLTYSSNLATEDRVTAYVKDGRYALVSLNWLKRNGIITDAIEVEPGKKWLIYSDRHNTLIDIENKRIASGQVVTDLLSTDKSPLITVDPMSKDILIDYRAIAGVASDYLVVKDSNGNITLSTDKNELTTTSTMSMYPLMGSGESTMSVIKKTNGDVLMSLEETYVGANYVIHRSRKNNVRQDYLIVAKPETDGVDKKASDLMKDATGMQLTKDFDVDIYEIGATVTSENTEDKPNELGDNVMFYPGTMEYHYKVPKEANTEEKTGKVMREYMKKDGSKLYPLPYVLFDNTLVDLNINLMYKETGETVELDLSEYPKALQNPGIQLKIFESGDNPPALLKMKLGISGLVGIYYPYGEYSWNEVIAMKPSPITYIGAMTVRPIKAEHEDREVIMLMAPNGGHSIGSIEKDEWDKKVFTQTFRGTSRLAVSYNLTQSLSSSIGDAINLDEMKDFLLGVSTMTKGTFDYIKAVELLRLNAMDTALTIAIMILIHIGPRVFIVWVILFATLSLVGDIRFIRTFCDRYFDIYKVLSLGLTSVGSLDIKSIWISSLIGITLCIVLLNELVFAELVVFFIEVILPILP